MASEDAGEDPSINLAELDVQAEPALFSPNERLAVLLGSRDSHRRIPAAFGLGWICRSLFGIRPPPPLADQRLEALRLLTIALRRRRSAARAIEDAALAGVLRSQINALISGR